MRIEILGTPFNDLGSPPQRENPAWVITLSKTLSMSVASTLDRKAFPLLLGGDCSMLVGIMAALIHKGPPVGLFFLDGHADFHSPETPPGGDPADRELAVLTGRGPHAITHTAGKYPMLEEEDIVFWGIRAWDRIDESPIQVYDRQQMAQRGIHAMVTEGLERFTLRGMPVWPHFEADVIDPPLMPVMFPEPDGLTVDETAQFLHLECETSRTGG